MANIVSGSPEDHEAVAANQIWSLAVGFVRRLPRYYPLYFVLLTIFIVLSFVMYTVIQPVYSATAVIGPPSASPASALMTSFDGAGGSTVKKLLGAATGGAQNDPFQEYLQVLHSAGLAAELAQKDNFLPLVFAAKWDAAHKRWRPPSTAHNILAAVSRTLNRPTSDHPDAHDLDDALSQSFKVSEATTGAASILSMGSSYMTVTLKAGSPERARNLLDALLNRADWIIREQQHRDVMARINYITSELPHITTADQREALIGILSSQEELDTMLVADKRFAFTIVDPAHASPVPSFPPAPIWSVLLSAMAALATLSLLVFLSARSRLARGVLAPFDRSKASRDTGAPVPQRRPAVQTLQSEIARR